MVCTTTMSEHEQNVPTSDEHLNSLIEEARNVTGDNWQIIEYSYIKKRLLSKNETCYWYQLLVEVGGFLPFQVIMAVRTANECRCYLMGLLSGHNSMHELETK